MVLQALDGSDYCSELVDSTPNPRWREATANLQVLSARQLGMPIQGAGEGTVNKIRITLLTVILAGTGCNEPRQLPTAAVSSDALASLETDTIPARRDDRWSWTRVDDSTLWAAVRNADGNVIIGLKRPDRKRGVYKGQLLMSGEDVERANQPSRSRLRDRHIDRVSPCNRTSY